MRAGDRNAVARQKPVVKQSQLEESALKERKRQLLFIRASEITCLSTEIVTGFGVSPLLRFQRTGNTRVPWSGEKKTCKFKAGIEQEREREIFFFYRNGRKTKRWTD